MSQVKKWCVKSYMGMQYIICLIAGQAGRPITRVANLGVFFANLGIGFGHLKLIAHGGRLVCLGVFSLHPVSEMFSLPPVGKAWDCIKLWLPALCVELIGRTDSSTYM